MVTKLRVHEETIRPSLVADLEAFRAPERRVSSYYLDLDPRHWGNTEAVAELMKKIAHRDGVGDMLAEGVMRAAQKIGGEAVNFAVHTAKGNTPRGHDHRGRWTEMFDTATSSTGTMETGPMSNMPLEALQAIGLDGPPDNFSGEEISTFNAKTKGAMVYEDSLGVCRFNTCTHLPLLTDGVNAVTGWDMDVHESIKPTSRSWMSSSRRAESISVSICACASDTLTNRAYASLRSSLSSLTNRSSHTAPSRARASNARACERATSGSSPAP